MKKILALISVFISLGLIFPEEGNAYNIGKYRKKEFSKEFNKAIELLQNQGFGPEVIKYLTVAIENGESNLSAAYFYRGLNYWRSTSDKAIWEKGLVDLQQSVIIKDKEKVGETLSEKHIAAAALAAKLGKCDLSKDLFKNGERIMGNQKPWFWMSHYHSENNFHCIPKDDLQAQIDGHKNRLKWTKYDTTKAWEFKQIGYRQYQLGDYKNACINFKNSEDLKNENSFQPDGIDSEEDRKCQQLANEKKDKELIDKYGDKLKQWEQDGFADLKVATAFTTGIAWCGFNASMDDVRFLMRRGWTITGQSPLNYQVSDWAGGTGRLFQCVGSQYFLQR